MLWGVVAPRRVDGMTLVRSEPVRTVIRTLERQFGLGLSFLTYYGQPHRLLALRRLYRPFIAPGDLCFDIGAHVGNRILVLRSLGARVVGVEPNADCMTWLRRLYGRDANVQLRQAALGVGPGKRTLWVSRRSPTVSTVDSSWRRQIAGSDGFRHVAWDETRTVPAETLDRLIDEYGPPALCKIDVEGAEDEVLAGLSLPLPVISFEYINAAWPRALACLTRLSSLGEYQFNWAIGERGRLQSASWLTQEELIERMDTTAARGQSGDIYARRLA